jgi:serine/threonine-protein kinase HipA
MARREELACWFGEHHVATITARRPWDVRLTYSDEALERWPSNTPLLSCSLPVQRKEQRATPFFRGLLPEGRQLLEAASLARVTTNDVFGLLAAYGRDVAGALVLSNEDPAAGRERWDVVEQDDATLAAEVAGLDDHPLGLHPDSELSLPGMQN